MGYWFPFKKNNARRKIRQYSIIIKNYLMYQAANYSHCAEIMKLVTKTFRHLEKSHVVLCLF